MTDPWSTAYVAVSVALGESLDDALASLATAERAPPTLEPRCAALVGALRSRSRAHRVKALADALAQTARSVEATALA